MKTFYSTNKDKFRTLRMLLSLTFFLFAFLFVNSAIGQASAKVTLAGTSLIQQTVRIDVGGNLTITAPNTEAKHVYRIQRTLPADPSFLEIPSDGGNLIFPPVNIKSPGEQVITVTEKGGNGMFSITINPGAPMTDNLFPNLFTQSGSQGKISPRAPLSEDIETIPALEANHVTVCTGGGVIVKVTGSVNGDIYRLQQTDPVTIDYQLKTGDGGTITFDTPAYASLNSVWTVINTTSYTLNKSFYIDIVPQPTAPVLSLSPAEGSICAGTGISATLNSSGTGGHNCSDSFDYSIDGGITWLSYTLGSTIPTTTEPLATVKIRAKRSDTQGRSCNAENIYTWTIYSHVHNVTPGHEGNYCTIQQAIGAAFDGDEIHVDDGTYIESNILVNKSLTIIGQSKNGVIIVPDAEDGNADNAFGSSAQNGFIIKANNITIMNLTLNGRGNPGLTPGKNNFRAGIVTADVSYPGGGGVWNNLHVDNVHIMYPYRRGISVYPLTISGTVIENSQIEYVAFNHGMYIAGQSYILNNTINQAFQGIVQALDNTTPAGLCQVNGNTLSNIGNYTGCWGYPNGQPRGIQFNNSYSAGRQVEIKDNIIGDNGLEMYSGAVGIYTRLANASSIVENNTITLSSGVSWADPGSQAVGLLLGWSYDNGFTAKNNHINSNKYGIGIMVFGNGTITNPLILEGNTLTSTNSDARDTGDGTGIFISNQYLFAGDMNPSYVIIRNNNEISGYVKGIDIIKGGTSTQPLTIQVLDNSATIIGNQFGIDANFGALTITGNTIKENETGVRLTGTATAVVHSNGIFDNTNYGLQNTTGVIIDAEDNWWGDASGPYKDPENKCGLGNKVSNDVDFQPWRTTPTGGAGSLTVHNVSLGTDYCTIQDAVQNASANNEIHIDAGTYVEVGQIVIDKNLTIIGADKSTTTISPSTDFASGGWIVVNNGITLNLSKVGLDGTGHIIHKAILFNGIGVIDDCKFNELKHGAYAGTAVAIDSPGNVNVTNCNFTQIGRNGILADGCTGTYSGNQYTGKGAGDWLDYFILSEYGDNIVISDNTISNCIGIALSDGSGSAAIAVWDDYGTTANISGNTMTGNAIGVAVIAWGGGTSYPHVVIGNGNLFDGGDFGVAYQTVGASYQPDVTYTGISTFKGQAEQAFYINDGISAGTNIDISTAEFQTSGGTTIADNFTKEDLCYHAIDATNRGLLVWDSPNVYVTENSGSIQRAINVVNSSWTVNVNASTYTENVNINKVNLTLKGWSLPVIDGGGTGTVVLVAANNATLDGFSIQHSGSGAGDAGVMINSKTGCTIKNNTVLNNANGIGLALANGNFVTNNVVNNNTYFGVAVVAGIGNTINLNNISSNGLDAIAVDNASALGGPVSFGSAGNFIKGNTISSNRDGIFLGENCDNNFITEANHITGVAGVGINLWRSDLQTITDNVITTANIGIRLLGSSNDIISGNEVTGNAIGLKADASWQVGVWYPCINNTITSNNISGNTIYGMQATENQGTVVIAENNWWGDATGPYHHINNTCGLGNTVSDYIDFMPWWTTPTGGSSDVLPVYNTDKGTYYCKIQDGINDADPGNHIVVAAGTYYEQLLIQKNLTLTGAGSGSTFVKSPSGIRASAPGYTGYNEETPWNTDYLIAAYPQLLGNSDPTINVKIDGFTFDANGESHQYDRFTGVFFRKVAYSMPAYTGLFNCVIKGFAGSSVTGVRVLDGCSLSVNGNTIQDYYMGIVSYGTDNLTKPFVTANYNIMIPGSGWINDDIEFRNVSSGYITNNEINYYNQVNSVAKIPVAIIGSQNIYADHNNISYGDVGILVDEATSQGCHLINNVITYITWNGLEIEGSNHVMSGNTIWDCGNNGIYLRGSSGNLIQNNQITDCNYPTFNGTIGDINAGNAAWAIAFDLGSNNNIATGNDLVTNDVGIENWDGTNNIANANKIYDNFFGVHNHTSIVMDASANWWGDESGPYHSPDNECGVGNDVSDYVTICNWYTDELLVDLNGCVTNVYTLSGPGHYCEGGYTTITLNGSQPDILYELYFEGTGTGYVQSGMGTSLIFDLITIEGTYSIHAFNTNTGCSMIMDGEIEVVMDPLPTLFTVTGGGHYCLNGTGVNVGLSDSESGVNYTLYFEGSATSNVQPGDGGSIDFGLQTIAGTYTVHAENAITGCNVDMTGEAEVVIDPTSIGGTVNSSSVNCSAHDGGTLTLTGHTGSVVRWEQSVDNGVLWTSIITTSTLYRYPAITHTTMYRAVVKSGECSEVASTPATIYFGVVTTVGTPDPVCYGNHIFVPVTVKSFKDVGIISLKLDFDHTFMTLTNVTYDGIPSNWNPGIDFIVDASLTNPDMIGAFGMGPGFSLQDDAVLFTMEFTYVGGTSGGTSNLTWNESDPNNCEYNLAEDGVWPVFCDDPTSDYYKNGHVTVYAQLTAPVASAIQTICNGETPNALSATASTGGSNDFSYQWQQLIAGIWTDLNGQIDHTSLILPALTATSQYRIYSEDVLCDGLNYSNIITINVYDVLVAGTSGSAQTICFGETPNQLNATAPTGGSGIYTYQWQNTDGLVDAAAWYDILGATDLIYSPGALTTTTGYRLLQTDTYCNPDDVVVTNEVTITVHGELTAGTASSDQVICYGDTPATISANAPTGGSSSFSYQWWSSTGSSWSTIPGANSLNYSPGSLTTTTYYRLDQIDNYCTPDDVVTTNMVTITVDQGVTVSGTLKYYKSTGTHIPMNGVEIWLTDGVHSPYKATSTTVSGGAYSFNHICGGDYTLVVHSNSINIGGINATDAAQVNYWGPHPYGIEQVRYQSGDVQNDYWMQATDAYMIQQYFVYGTPFTRTVETGTPWTYWKTGSTIISNTNPYPTPVSWPTDMNVTVGGVPVTYNIYGMAIGDFNSSLNFTKENSTTVILVNNGTRQVNPNTEIEVPVNIVNASQVGAVSLIMNFPSDLVEVKDVYINGASGQLDWSIKGNELRIGWNSINPLVLSAGSELLTLKLKTTNEFSSGHKITFTLTSDPLIELADNFNNPIPGSILSMDVLDAGAIGIPTPSGAEFLLQNHPNPFNEFTVISYTLPIAGNVTLEIHNLIGEHLKTIVSENQSQGAYTFKYDASYLAPGVYTVTLKLKGAGDELIRTIKLIKSN